MGKAVDRLLAKLAGPADEARDDHGRWSGGGGGFGASAAKMLGGHKAGDVVRVTQPGHPSHGKVLKVEKVGSPVGGIGGGGHVFVTDQSSGERFATSRYLNVESVSPVAQHMIDKHGGDAEVARMPDPNISYVHDRAHAEFGEHQNHSHKDGKL